MRGVELVGQRVRRMVAAHGMNGALPDASPERVSIGLVAKWRLTDVFRPLAFLEALAGEMKVERASLDVHWNATRLRFGAHPQSPSRGHVHDVDRRACELCDC